MLRSELSAAAFAANGATLSALLLNIAVTPFVSVTLADGAENHLEEVVVTAERRASDAHKIAASLTVRIGEELLKNGKFSLQQILDDVPGVGEPFAEHHRQFLSRSLRGAWSSE